MRMQMKDLIMIKERPSEINSTQQLKITKETLKRTIQMKKKTKLQRVLLSCLLK